MRPEPAPLGTLLLACFLLLACGDDPAPADPKVESLDDLLSRACELAADCVPSTEEDVRACPGDLREEISLDDLALLEWFVVERFVPLSREDQNDVLQCFDEEICDRFGVSLASMSDSDFLETFGECVLPAVPAPSGPGIGTLDDLLDRVCEISAYCVPADQRDTGGCAEAIRAGLTPEQIAGLETFVAEQLAPADLVIQEVVLQCMLSDICYGLDGSLGNLEGPLFLQALSECVFPLAVGPGDR